MSYMLRLFNLKEGGGWCNTLNLETYILRFTWQSNVSPMKSPLINQTIDKHTMENINIIQHLSSHTQLHLGYHCSDIDLFQMIKHCKLHF